MTLWPRQLWWRIWLAVIATIVVFALLAGIAWRMYFDPARVSPNPDAVAEAVVEQLPGAQAPRAEQQRALERIQRRSDIDAALFDPAGELIALVGRPVPPPRTGETDSHWLMPRPLAAGDVHPHRPRRPSFALHLADGRWLVVRREAPSVRPPPFGLLWMLAVIAAAVGVGSYPIARRLTRRLERLQASVDALGAGDLSTRVEVQGHDEVAALAERFNRAAARIEALMTAQKNLLANASHELRSPLARIRMAVEILGERPSADLLAEVRRNVAELDGLVEEILLASRLDAAGAAPDPSEDVDLTALVAEECAQANANFQAEAASVRGDPRLLRRLLRNLIENAQRHGAGSVVEVGVKREDGCALIEVRDRGPGIPERERERVFEPFYRVAGSRERDGGVGLGLALVRQIAQRHGGTVECRAREGGGVCFAVRLPSAG